MAATLFVRKDALSIFTVLSIAHFLLRLKKQISLKWGGIGSVLQIICAILTFVVIAIVVSAFVNLDWISNYRSVLNLIGLVIVGVIGVVSGFFSIFTQVFLDYRAAQLSYRALERITISSLQALDSRPKGIPVLIPRDEIQTILGYIREFKPVIFTGEAGTGKSKIAVDIIQRNLRETAFCILLDARMLAGVNNKAELRNFFDIEESAYELLNRLGRFVHTVLIIDQIDNIAGTQSCNVVIEFLQTCSNFEGVSTVAISRHRESNEQGAIKPLLEAGFNEVVCSSISSDVVVEILGSFGLQNISPKLLGLAGNLLNLDIICEIIQFSNIEDIQNVEEEIVLWEKYRLTLFARENQINNTGEVFILEAVRLARSGLTSFDRCFDISAPSTSLERRLISGNVISQVGGRKYQFSHDKLQDYLYAWDACERNLDFDQVSSELNGLHLRNVYLRMIDIYELRQDVDYETLLNEALSG